VTAVARQPASTVASPAATAKLDYGAAFAQSRNLWEFAHRILPAARAGDADAQFYLSKALEQCARDNKMFYQRRGLPLTSDQGIQWALQRHLSLDVAQAVYERCHEFLEQDASAVSELGDSNDWLQQATHAGQPLAQAATAMKLFLQQILQNIQIANGVSNPDARAPIKSEQSPVSLLREAVESRNPEVLFAIGEAQGFLGAFNREATVNQLAWWLVACRRGLDCSANAEWIKVACANDARCASFTDPSAFVRAHAGDDWDNVEQLAGEIDAKLDAGRWDELGLGF
jgi:hypothetical protein